MLLVQIAGFRGREAILFDWLTKRMQKTNNYSATAASLLPSSMPFCVMVYVTGTTPESA
jgi:hypothetical protein